MDRNVIIVLIIIIVISLVLIFIKSDNGIVVRNYFKRRNKSNRKRRRKFKFKDPIIDTFESLPKEIITNPSIEIRKSVNGDDANTFPGLSIATHKNILITYEVINTGDSNLSNIVLVDDLFGTITDSPLFGDENNIGLLEPGETWIYQRTTYVENGQNTSGVMVTATEVNTGEKVVDSDSVNYFGVTS